MGSDEGGERSGSISWGFWLGIALFIATLLIPSSADFPPAQRNVLALALLMAAWWMSAALPLGVTALLPLALYPFLGVMSTKQVAHNYSHHLVFLFLGGFLIAAALQECGLHKRIALHTIALLGTSPRRLIVGFMAASAFLSMWISNTATALMLMPIGLGVIRKIQGTAAEDQPERDTFGTALMLGIAYSASIGGIATLIGTPPNLVFSGVYSDFFPQAAEFTFARWFVLILPLSILFFVGAALFLALVIYRPRRDSTPPHRDLLARELEELGPMSPAEKRVLAIFALTAALWIFRADLPLGAFTLPGWPALLGLSGHIQDSTIAIAMAVALFILPAGPGPRRRPLLQLPSLLNLPWDILLLFGGGFALANGIQSSGLAAQLGHQLLFLGNLPPFLLLVVLTLSIALLTEFTSNTAVATTTLPIMAGLAQSLHMDPVLIMVPATVAASCAFLLPVATPPNAIVFGTRYIPIQKMVRAGIVLEIYCALLASAYFLLVLY